MTIRPIALTLGDPSGIGPEITLKAWKELRGDPPFFLIGDLPLMTNLAAAHDVPLEEIRSPDKVPEISARALPVLHYRLPQPAEPGTPEPKNAPAVIEIIRTAVSLAMSKSVSAIVTNPINKQVLHNGAGFGFPGHTEFLASLGGVQRGVMMLAVEGLRVVPVTIHIPLATVKDTLTPELLRETIKITHRSLRADFGIEQTRIAVAGLNPHAGEGGNIGREEIDWISEELGKLRATGMDIVGPLPADTMFHTLARSKYDVAICMYHDQALIPIKTIDFALGVNITLGLPFVRTSPDHGTAYDIAGKGIADPRSLIAALRQASEIALRRDNAK